MMNSWNANYYQNIKNLPQKCKKKEPIPFGERLSNGITNFFFLLGSGLTSLCLAPIAFVRTLCFTEREVIDDDAYSQWVDELQKSLDKLNEMPPPKLSLEIKPPEGHDEPWKKAHDDMYGEEDEDL